MCQRDNNPTREQTTPEGHQYVCSSWDCYTVMTAVTIFCLFYRLCLFCTRIVVNITEFDATVIQVSWFSAIKPGSIHHFLHLKMPVYDSCCPFVWCVLSFDFASWLGTFRFEFFSEFSIFVILLFETIAHKINQSYESYKK